MVVRVRDGLSAVRIPAGEGEPSVVICRPVSGPTRITVQ